MRFFKTAPFVLSLLLSATAISIAQKMKAEDVVAKHLEAIGTADARAAVKTRVAVGDASAKFTSTKDQVVQGRIVLASEGPKNFMGMSMNSSLYPSERFIYDGKKADVAFVQVNNRSILGNFVMSNNFILHDSTLGGALASSWVLLNNATDKGKLSFDGIKKIDGREVYALGYSRKGSGDLDITFYFDKETFRHVRTEYKRTSSAGIGSRPEDSTKFSETRLKVTEDFSDFKTENGLTLPRKYTLFYSISGQAGTTEAQWTFNLTEIGQNMALDAKTFDIP
jgi:hypothetical protein